MELIREMLTNAGIQFNEAAINELINQTGASNEEQFRAIANELIAQSNKSITKASPKGAVAKKNSRGRKRDANPEQALTFISKQSSDEIVAVSEVLKQGVDIWTEREATEAINIIRNAPNQFFEKIIEKSQMEAADAEGFRLRAQAIAQTAFGINFSDDAE